MTERSSESGSERNHRRSTTTSKDNHKRKRAESSPDHDQQQLCPQQRYVKRPKHPGMVTFDGSLRALPLQGSKAKRQRSSPNTPLMSGAREGTYDTDAYYTDHSSDGTVDVLVSTSAPRQETEQLLASENHVDPQPHIPQPSIDVEPESIPITLDTTIQPQIVNTVSTIPQETEGQMLIGLSRQLYVPRPTIDAKLIYADLIGPHQNSSTGEKTDGRVPNWRALDRLRQNILNNSHDFFGVSQDPQAPDSLRRLALAYGMPLKWTRAGLKIYTPFLGQMLERSQDEILSFISRAKNLLDILDEKFRAMRQDWAQINGSVHHFLHILMGEGLNSYCVYQCEWFKFSARWRDWESQKHAPDDTLDQELRERHFQQFSPPPLVHLDEVEERYLATGVLLKPIVLCLLSGWLCHGSRIARTFHEFCKVFKFLAWVGATF